ncbi:MAG: hypothetical protein NTV14_08040 [Coprothermobacterota bacterium]|nr:hypothetical protein [Coprothermobacterota bacterium]
MTVSERCLCGGQPRRPWQMGELSLTDDGFSFSQGTMGTDFKSVPIVPIVPLDCLQAWGLDYRPLLGKEREALRVQYIRQPAGGQPAAARQLAAASSDQFEEAWFLPKDPSVWIAHLNKATGRDSPPLPPSPSLPARHRRTRSSTPDALPGESGAGTPQTLSNESWRALLRQFPGPSQELLIYLARNRHAEIETIRVLLGVENHSLALRCIEGELNGTARRLLSQPLLAFYQSRKDTSLGKTITFRWWLEVQPSEIPAGPADVFAEDEEWVVFCPVGLVGEADLLLERAGSLLLVAPRRPGAFLPEEIPLPADAGDILTWSLGNGILTVHLERKKGKEMSEEDRAHE